MIGPYFSGQKMKFQPHNPTQDIDWKKALGKSSPKKSFAILTKAMTSWPAGYLLIFWYLGIIMSQYKDPWKKQSGSHSVHVTHTINVWYMYLHGWLIFMVSKCRFYGSFLRHFFKRDIWRGWSWWYDESSGVARWSSVAGDSPRFGDQGPSSITWGAVLQVSWDVLGIGWNVYELRILSWFKNHHEKRPFGGSEHVLELKVRKKHRISVKSKF